MHDYINSENQDQHNIGEVFAIDMHLEGVERNTKIRRVGQAQASPSSKRSLLLFISAWYDYAPSCKEPLAMKSYILYLE